MIRVVLFITGGEDIMESRRDIKRAIEKEIKKGSASVIFSGLRFESDTYHLIQDEDKMNHILDYLFRNGEFANLADEQVRSNIYFDNCMGIMKFRSAKNEFDRKALQNSAKKYIAKKKPTYENNIYVENLICCFTVEEDKLKKRQCTYKGQDGAAMIFSKKHLECIYLQCLMDRREIMINNLVPENYSEAMKRIYMLDDVDVLFQCLLMDTMDEDNGQLVAQMTTIYSLR